MTNSVPGSAASKHSSRCVPQFREDGKRVGIPHLRDAPSSGLVTCILLRFPVDVLPSQGKSLRWTSEAAVSPQCEQQAPLIVGTRLYHLVRFIARDEIVSARVLANCRRQPGEWIRRDESMLHCVVEELFCDATSTTDRVFGQWLVQKIEAEVVRISLRDVVQSLVPPEERNQVSSCVSVNGLRSPASRRFGVQ